MNVPQTDLTAVRLATVGVLLEDASEAFDALTAERARLMADLRRDGWGFTAIAAAAGISRQRVAQILEGSG